MKDLKGMDTKQMMKCEGCGEYHPIEECEVVVIKIIKGKACAMPSTKAPVTPVVRYIEPHTDVLAQQKEDREPNAQREPTAQERELIAAIIKKKKAMPPAGLAGVFGAPPA